MDISGLCAPLKICKKHRDKSLATTSIVSTLASADTAGHSGQPGLESHDLNGTCLEGLVLASTRIRRGLLRRVLTDNLSQTCD